MMVLLHPVCFFLATFFSLLQKAFIPHFLRIYRPHAPEAAFTNQFYILKMFLYFAVTRSREEMEHHVAKKQVVEREESKRAQNKGSTQPPDQGTTVKKLYSLSDCVQLREVWVQQAALLIKQVQQSFLHY